METENANLFMMCRALDRSALTAPPAEYPIRSLARNELPLWLDLQCEGGEDRVYLESYFRRVYAPQEDEFWRRCLVICDAQDRPAGTCMAWRAYGCLTTVHWFRVRASLEGRGLGRALLSRVMTSLSPEEFPVYLHTQPASFRAVKLYTDFGFALLRDPRVGFRDNGLSLALPYFRQVMPPPAYASLRFEWADDALLRAAASTTDPQF